MQIWTRTIAIVGHLSRGSIDVIETAFGSGLAGLFPVRNLREIKSLANSPQPPILGASEVCLIAAIVFGVVLIWAEVAFVVVGVTFVAIEVAFVIPEAALVVTKAALVVMEVTNVVTEVALVVMEVALVVA